MLKRPPREKAWISWLLAGAWAYLILISVGQARLIQGYVSSHYGSHGFRDIVLSAVVVGVGFVLLYLVRLGRHVPFKNLFWLLGVAAVFVFWTLALGRNPEEAMHFVQYGILSLFFYRALLHRTRNAWIYPIAVALSALVGTYDEFLQWATPRRYFDYKDIGLNIASATLVQICLAKGIVPSVVNARPTAESRLVFLRLLIVESTLLLLCLYNTPENIYQYTSRLGWFEFLRYNESVMTEFGYLYADPDIGVYKSRMTEDELREKDQSKGEALGRIIKEYALPKDYRSFLNSYTPGNAPFLHEARVHMARRDRWRSSAWQYKGEDPEEYQRHYTIAYRENQILEKHFSNTIHQAGVRFGSNTVAGLKSQLLEDERYISPVSSRLITRMSRGQTRAPLWVLLGLLVFLERRTAASARNS